MVSQKSPIQLIFVILLYTLPCFGQWVPEGIILGNMTNAFNADLDAVNIGNGNVVVAWDYYNHGTRNIYIQYVDTAGYTHWGPGGLLVCPDTSVRQQYPSVLGDGEGGVFVVWADWRHSPGEGVALYGQRLDSLGNRLWDSTGVRLTYGPKGHTTTKLYSDGQGGFICIDYNLIAQRVTGDGNILWDSSGITLGHTDLSGDYKPITCQISSGIYITCWWRDWGGDSSYYDDDIYMQKFDLNGNIYWGESGKPVVHYPDGQGYLDNDKDIVSDGQGGFVVNWIDHRNYRPWSMVYADRFDSNGQSLWQENGQPIGLDTADVALETQVFRLDNPTYMFSTYLFLLGGGQGFRAYLLDSSGLLLWPHARTLDTLTVWGRTFMEPDGIFKYISARDFYIPSKIDTSGHQYWPYRSVALPYCSRLHTLNDCYGGLIAVGNDGYPYVRIWRVYASGRLGGDTTGIYDNTENIPKAFSLRQNYPNPFNGNTNIQFELAQSDNLILEIYNVVGQHIIQYKLINQPAGINTILLDMSKYPSGIYFLRLSTSEGIEEKIKLTLIK
jgi:hypothetical protein